MVAETGRDETQGAVVLVGIATQDKDANEEGLVDDEHEQRGEEEAGEAACGVVELDVVVDYRLHKVGSLLTGNACKGVALQLDGVHLVDEDVVASEEGVFVVEERAHVAHDSNAGGTQRRQTGAIVVREVEDGMDAVVVHQMPGFGQVATMVSHFDFGSGFEFVDETVACLAVGVVDNGHGEVDDGFFVIYRAEDERIEQGGYEEDQHDHGVGEDAPHLSTEHLPDVEQRSFDTEFFAVVRRLKRMPVAGKVGGIHDSCFLLRLISIILAPMRKTSPKRSRLTMDDQHWSRPLPKMAMSR